MERGSRIAIYKLKEVVQKDGKKFYVATVIENVFNQHKPFNNGFEQVFVKAYIFDMSIELQPATWGDLKGADKRFSFDNITNPEESIVRIENCKVEVHSKWNYGQQVKENGLPAYETIAYISKICKDKDFKTDNRKEKEMLSKIAKLENNIEKLKVTHREKVKELKNTIRRLTRQIEKQEEIVNEARTELNIIPNNKLNRKVRVMEYDDVYFDDM